MVVFGGVFYIGDICVFDDCFQVLMVDFFGDGWNGNYLDIIDINGNVIGSFIIVFGTIGSVQFVIGFVVCVVYGCIDFVVVNFDVFVNMDDGLCIYSCIVVLICENFDGIGIGFFN